MKAKVIRSLWVVILPLVVQQLEAESKPPAQNHFDLLAKALAPFIALATSTGSEGNHAVDFQATIVELAGLPPELQGAQVRLAVEFPNKFSAQIPTANGPINVGSRGERIWLHPASRLQPLKHGLAEERGENNKHRGSTGFRLTQTEALLLPALLNVRDAGKVDIGKETFRVLDLGLVPELKIKDIAGWSARVWIRPENNSFAQLEIRTPNGSVTLLVVKTNFRVSLPSDTFEPAPEQRPDVAETSVSEAMSLIEQAVKQPAGQLLP